MLLTPRKPLKIRQFIYAKVLLVTTIDYEQATPSLSQAQRMKKFSQEGKLSEDVMLAIMSEEKKGELLTAKANVDRILNMEAEQDAEKEKGHGQR